MKDKLRLLILESAKVYKCDYASRLVVDNIFKAFDEYEFSQETWLAVFRQVISRVYRDLGKEDYKDIKRVCLPIGMKSKKMMAMFYENKNNRRYISNFKIYSRAM